MLSLAVSVVTLWGMWLVARKDWRGWAVGIVNQLLWVWLAIDSRAYGLLLLTAALLWLYARALVAWRREARDGAVL